MRAYILSSITADRNKLLTAVSSQDVKTEDMGAEYNVHN